MNHGRRGGRELREQAVSMVALLVPFVSLGTLAVASGGYFPPDWRRSGVALAAVGIAALSWRERLSASRRELWTVAALSGLVAWIALSAVWSADASRSLLEAERTLVLLAGVVAFLLVADQGARCAVAGLVAGITSATAYGLGKYLLGERVLDPIEGGLLFRPIGYANAVAIFAAIGALLAVGAMAKGRRGLTAFGAGALPVLLSAMVLAASRAAWVALLAGLGVVLLLDPERRQTIARVSLLVAPALAAAVLFAQADIARSSLAPAAFADEARRLAVLLVVLSATGAVVAILAPRDLVRTSCRTGVGVAVVLVGAITVWLPSADVDLELGSRPQYWRVALESYEDHRWLGTGAGTYDRSWSARHPIEESVRDAHSLYLESLSELGPVGLGLLLAALAVPLSTAIAARREPLVPAAAAAYAAYLIHAGLDWDWEVPAVTLAGLMSVSAVLVAARPGARQIELSPLAVRLAILLEALLVALFLARLSGVV